LTWNYVHITEMPSSCGMLRGWGISLLNSDFITMLWEFQFNNVTSSNVLGRQVLHDQIGWNRGRWEGAPER